MVSSLPANAHVFSATYQEYRPNVENVIRKGEAGDVYRTVATPNAEVAKT